ncbi:hypothetical protein HYS47_01430 [Candidatus Woesearchaeota archaeon]|nr:hypothetical protein [Candidatus Woesearchaeota archaeon]
MKKKNTTSLRKPKSVVKNVSKTRPSGTRPVLITFLCILAWVGISLGIVMNGVLLAFPSFFRWFGLSFPQWYTLSSLLLTIISIFVWLAIWNMRKAGVIGYIATSILGWILLSFQVSTQGYFGVVWAIIINGVVIALLLMKYKEMR